MSDEKQEQKQVRILCGDGVARTESELKHLLSFAESYEITDFDGFRGAFVSVSDELKTLLMNLGVSRKREDERFLRFGVAKDFAILMSLNALKLQTKEQLSNSRSTLQRKREFLTKLQLIAKVLAIMIWATIFVAASMLVTTIFASAFMVTAAIALSFVALGLSRISSMVGIARQQLSHLLGNEKNLAKPLLFSGSLNALMSVAAGTAPIMLSLALPLLGLSAPALLTTLLLGATITFAITAVVSLLAAAYFYATGSDAIGSKSPQQDLAQIDNKPKLVSDPKESLRSYGLKEENDVSDKPSQAPHSIAQAITAARKDITEKALVPGVNDGPAAQQGVDTSLPTTPQMGQESTASSSEVDKTPPPASPEI